jgi:uncharacterized membrane protein (UPF0127 family)
MTARRVLFILLVLAASLPSFLEARGKKCPIHIVNSRGEKVRLLVEIADDDRTRSLGLMHRRGLEPDSGMLFVFPDERRRNFWMKNTFIPLSSAYGSAAGGSNELYDMKPLDVSVTYPSTAPARYAIEAPRGWFRERGIVPGCRVVFNGCLGK